MRAALGAGDGMHLVEDERLDGAKRVARLRGEHQVERLGRRDQDVGRLLEELAALLRGRVAGAGGDTQRRRRPSPGVAVSRSIADRKAVSVLPEPVGAWMRTWPPAAIAGQPS